MSINDGVFEKRPFLLLFVTFLLLFTYLTKKVKALNLKRAITQVTFLLLLHHVVTFSQPF